MTLRGSIARVLPEAAFAVVAAFVAGCTREGDPVPVQSALHPASPAAAAIVWLWWLMFWICTAIFVLVLLLLALGLIRRRRADCPTAPLGTGFIVAGGIVMPAVVLVVLLIANLRTAVALHEDETVLTVRVIGHQWWWEVEYPEFGIVTANELHIPVGRPVRVELRSADVIHSFWVPRLGGKMDMIPGIDLTNYILRADRPGEYRGQCAEYCGLQHALMAFHVVALPPARFDDWVAAKRASRPEPVDDRLKRGRSVFAAAACGNCHAVGGTEFKGRIGPNLTHLASRLTLGAGTVPNNRGNLEGWIADPQPIKPGNLMPRTYLPPDDLRALADYLETLK